MVVGQTSNEACAFDRLYRHHVHGRVVVPVFRTRGDLFDPGRVRGSCRAGLWGARRGVSVAATLGLSIRGPGVGFVIYKDDPPPDGWVIRRYFSVRTDGSRQP